MSWRHVMACCAALLGTLGVGAHPLGNNTVNRQSTLTVAPAAVELRYLMDLAEIPTLLAGEQADQNGDGQVTRAEWEAHARRWADELRAQLKLALDDKPLKLRLKHLQWKRVPGDAGLDTLLLEAHYAAPLRASTAAARLTFRDRYKADSVGWKEISMRGDGGVHLAQATAASTDRSRGLTDFTLPPGVAPPNELDASVEIAWTGVAGRQAAGALDAAAAPSAAPLLSEAADASGRATWHQAWQFFRLGVHHIATGWDHLVFILGLILLGSSLPWLIKIITAFTLAHSLTLALAATGLVVPPGAMIEPAIALTIAYVGWQSLRRQRNSHGVVLALGFGLVHGFGFAGALAQSLADGAAPLGGNWLIKLASFNLGIEVFQVLLVAALVPLLRLAARASWSVAAHRVASVTVLLAGLAWFIERALPQIV